MRMTKEEIKKRNEPPKLTLLEEIGNAITHGVGAALSIAAFVAMLLKSDTSMKVMASCFYGICMILLFTMSCLYHSWKHGLAVKKLWRRFDYASIYLLIGGTFAPLCLVYWGDTKGIVMFCIQWGLIVTGITFISIFGPARFRAIHFTLYFLIGWSGLLFVPGMVKNDFWMFILILSGGIIYTIGMVPFAMKKKGSHFIWHIFVLLGAATMWLGIWLFIYLK
ncbi:MAG: hemolysin III family protein [Clostridiales bacterium]|nr:hemolysin III family protein [Clostridiales bacterium]MBR4819245.1 hemolysin III family protein [Clostridiales bacterium]MBR5057583.1 hemolysin III family protein [Clostridiales bacterium]